MRINMRMTRIIRINKFASFENSHLFVNSYNYYETHLAAKKEKKTKKTWLFETNGNKKWKKGFKKKKIKRKKKTSSLNSYD
jgi:hypothetical protein